MEARVAHPGRQPDTPGLGRSLMADDQSGVPQCQLLGEDRIADHRGLDHPDTCEGGVKAGPVEAMVGDAMLAGLVNGEDARRRLAGTWGHSSIDAEIPLLMVSAPAGWGRPAGVVGSVEDAVLPHRRDTLMRFPGR
jgi:hypothetical protein